MKTEDDITAIYKEIWDTPSDLQHSAQFNMRAEEATQQGIELLKLSDACKQIGFLGVPLDFYLTEAAHDAGIPLAPLLQRMLQNAQNAWVALAKAVAIPATETSLMIRAMVAQSLMPAGPMSRYRRAVSGEPGLSVFHPQATTRDYEVLLERIEGDYNPANKANLATLLESYSQS